MQIRRLVVFLVSVAFVVGACDGGDDDAGTSGPVTSSTVANSTVMTTGPVGCDTGRGMSFDTPECRECIRCTQTLDCEEDWVDCVPGQPCGDFVDCLDQCDTMCGSDALCFNTCAGLDVQTASCRSSAGCLALDGGLGCDQYFDALSCSVCIFCAGDCDSAANCTAN